MHGKASCLEQNSFLSVQNIPLLHERSQSKWTAHAREWAPKEAIKILLGAVSWEISRFLAKIPTLNLNFEHCVTELISKSLI